MSALVDTAILNSTARSVQAQGLAYLIRLNASGARAKGIAPLTLPEATAIVAAYWERGAHYGIAPDAAFAEALVETAAWTFGGQVGAAQHNVAGLGATNDGASGGGWPDWPRGIDAHFVHLLAWCGDPRGDSDYRIVAVRATATAKGHATTWRSLGGRWAVRDGVPWQQQATMPNSYGDGIERHWQGIVTTPAASAAQGGSMAVTKPTVTAHPSPNRGYNGAAYKPEAIVWHITAGSGASAVSWLTSPASNASANYVVLESGETVELVNPESGANGAAWANGDVQQPDMTNPLIAGWVKAGINPNLRVVSIEHAGQTSAGKGGSLTPAQIAATVRLTAWLCQRFGIAPDQDHILGHYQINDVTRHNCPGFSAAEWTAWVGRIAALVKGGIVDQSQKIAQAVTPAHPDGYMLPGQADSFTWPDGEGVITYRKVRYFNPQENAYYEAEWSNDGGFAPWKQVA